MSILVTGATGYIGRHLVRHLCHTENKQVVVLVRNSSDTAVLDGLPVTIIYDAEPGQLSEDVNKAGVEGVIHLASWVVSAAVPDDFDRLIEANISFGLKLLEATNKKIRWFVNTGTFWQHYQGEQYSPVNLYAAAKQAFITLARYYQETSNLNFVTLEVYDNYGPGDDRPKLLNLWKRLADSNDQLKMTPGHQEIDLCHIDDVTRAYATMASLLENDQKHRFNNATFSVRSGRVLSLRQLADIFQSVSQKKLNIEWGARDYREREMLKIRDLFEAVPQWSPEVKLEEGLREFILNE